MERKRVVALRRLKAPQLARLREAFDVDYFDVPEHHPVEVANSLSRAHGLIGGKLHVTTALLDAAPFLEAVSTISVGYDNLPVAELSRRKILLTNTPDVLTETTADTGFLLLMASARRAIELANMVREGRWNEHIGEPWFGRNVHGKTLGLVGFGRIGQAVARRAFGFGMSVLYSNASPKPALESQWGVRRCSLDALLAESDFVCLTVPLTPETTHLIGYDQCRSMKRSAFLVNIARGHIVDEAGLIRALDEGLIAGAGLDVFEQEPVSPESPLLRMDNVVTLPHVGSATHETREAMADCAVENLCQALHGKRPRDLVNPDAWVLRHGAAPAEEGVHDAR
ncbi:2-hydroxyacid dehydrogenase [Pseudomonas matsuisoli]|uniref:Bifunctional glyoxylate/hydroxypyruvate reductase B n=1 Tax=Pseudomonas matsuisoli TaxID=1515666 RepID=A0A917PZJ1_9PSED|nr:D-glycerate dehydrogenase [Pseudomonas matsuisoli]GGK00954.1 bifunctional glyoxylate/hydroxypyruvate reductase B [Pseudomonas matsuisoli]